jgi:hypothetical protein
MSRQAPARTRVLRVPRGLDVRHPILDEIDPSRAAVAALPTGAFAA